MSHWIPPESGVGSEGPPAAGYPPDRKGDKDITTAVETAILLEPTIDEGRFAVRTEQGVVFLMGTARSEREKQQVFELVRGIDGVREVINQIRVENK